MTTTLQIFQYCLVWYADLELVYHKKEYIYCLFVCFFAVKRTTKFQRFTNSCSVGSKAVAQWCTVKNLFLKTSQNWQEDICAKITFLIKLQTWGWELPGGCFIWSVFWRKMTHRVLECCIQTQNVATWNTTGSSAGLRDPVAWRLSGIMLEVSDKCHKWRRLPSILLLNFGVEVAKGVMKTNHWNQSIPVSTKKTCIWIPFKHPWGVFCKSSGRLKAGLTGLTGC